MRPAITPAETVQAIRKRYKDGESLAKIARALMTSVSTVQKHTRDLPRRNPKQLTGKTVRDIYALREQGHRRELVAKTLGVSVSSVKRYEPKSAATRRRTAAPTSRHR